MKVVDRYAGLPLRRHLAISAISFVVYVGIIVLAFVPLSCRLEMFGGSTMDFQESADPEGLLLVWGAEGRRIAVALTLADSVSIVAGLLLLLSLNS